MPFVLLYLFVPVDVMLVIPYSQVSWVVGIVVALSLYLYYIGGLVEGCCSAA